MQDTVQAIQAWHAAARPEPTDRDFNVQLGCHFEEISEMIDAIATESATSDAMLLALKEMLHVVSDMLKDGRIRVSLYDAGRKTLLDALCDQIVTAVGVGYCVGMDVHGACAEVNRSNWSKFVDGKPIRDKNGKIAKGPHYSPPDLTPYL